MEHDVDVIEKDLGNELWATNSIEFCGGTHLSNTAEAEAFALVEETAVSKGIRRVVGITGPTAVEATKQGENQLPYPDSMVAPNRLMFARQERSWWPFAKPLPL